MTKVCKCCEVEKSLEEFYRRKSDSDERVSPCKECRKVYRQDNREVIAEKKSLREKAERWKKRITRKNGVNRMWNT
jgi:hypothetical protein